MSDRIDPICIRIATFLTLFPLVTIAAIVIAAFLFHGCSALCWYKGKAISREDAKAMRAMGMDAQCPVQ